MRIISGNLRNRQFNVPDAEVRPTMESVREAIFSALGGHCEGLNVLDLFAGSGALGMEAWSRGAASVCFVEKSSKVWKTLQGNIQSLENKELGPTKCIKADALAWIDRSRPPFDLILADPPYDLPNAFQQTLDRIARHCVLTADGMLVYELRLKGDVEIPKPWRVLRDKKYGKTRILILKQDSKGES